MPDVGAGCVTFRHPDPGRNLQGVALVQEIARPRVGPSFVRPANGPEWVGTLPTPDVDRFEYLLQLQRVDGRTDAVPDPANPLLAAGPFGSRSVVELPGYHAPAWLSGPVAPPGTTAELRVSSRELHRALDAVLWTSAGHRFDEELPLLAVHDGVDYARYSSLLALLDRAVASRRLPPCHTALLVPSRRDDDYGASAAYSRALAEELMPAITSRLRTPASPQARVGMGTSLGGLAMLHAHHYRPGTFGALFLQSATLFLAGCDAHEAARPHFRRIVGFVQRMLDHPGEVEPVPMVLTCGTVEENLHGNRAVAAALAARSGSVRLVAVRDAHNWTAWRDTFDPHLLALLNALWS